MEQYPYLVECASSDPEPSAALYRMRDGKFQIISPGRLEPLIVGPDHILAESSLAATLLAVCMPDIEVRSAVIVRAATGETFTSHAEVFPPRELEQGDFASGTWRECNAWRFAGHHLFVAPHVRDALLSLGVSSLEFSHGLSKFA